MVYKGSHLLHSAYKKAAKPTEKGDWYKFKSDETFQAVYGDCERVKVECEPGDIVLWDSRTVHYAVKPTRESKTGMRQVVYLSYQPRSLAKPKDLLKKQDIFNKRRMTTHWAAKPKMFAANPRTYGNEQTVEDKGAQQLVLPAIGYLLAGFPKKPAKQGTVAQAKRRSDKMSMF